METIEQLMTDRHAAYVFARENYFEKGLDEWREANRLYVIARRRLQHDPTTAIPHRKSHMAAT